MIGLRVYVITHVYDSLRTGRGQHLHERSSQPLRADDERAKG